MKPDCISMTVHIGHSRKFQNIKDLSSHLISATNDHHTMLDQNPLNLYLSSR
jgi:hypothetical protein